MGTPSIMSKQISHVIVIALFIIVMSGCRDHTAAATPKSPASRTATTTTPIAERVVGNIDEPVALVFLSNDILLVAERRSGRIRWVERGQLRQEPFATVAVPHVSGYNEHGLLGLAVDPGYPAQPYLYAFHTVPNAQDQPVGQEVVRFTIANGRGTQPLVIIPNLPVSAGCCHNGGRIHFGPDGKLYVSIGDTLRQNTAQDPRALSGKILRYNRDGTIPADNPFRVLPGNRPNAVFTMGHRNVFGIAVNPDTRQIYVTENGPNTNDEINHLVAGANYGWPTALGVTRDSRFRPPLWTSGNTTIAPTGATFYTGTDFPAFHGDLLFANYNDGRLRRAIFSTPDSITGVETIAAAGGQAKLDVAISPTGVIYYSSMSAIYRLRPQ